jgi:leucine dehydrogenase
MSYKSIMAGLPYGGAKTALIKPKNFSPQKRKAFLQAFSQKVNELKGKYITGADVGIDDADLKIMYKASPYMVGLKSQPVPYTALGIFFSLEVVLKEIFGSKDISGRTFAIQGMGKIGSHLLKLIYKEARQVYVADVCHATLRKIKKQFPRVSIVQPQDIYSQKVDVFSPCALSGSLNKESVKQLQCQAIVGGANNQLDCSSIGEKLFRSGILYAPDYVNNAGGLISVTEEYENPIQDKDRLIKKVKRIATNMEKILETSKLRHVPTNIVADQMAESILQKKYEKQLAVARV